MQSINVLHILYKYFMRIISFITSLSQCSKNFLLPFYFKRQTGNLRGVELIVQNSISFKERRKDLSDILTPGFPLIEIVLVVVQNDSLQDVPLCPAHCFQLKAILTSSSRETSSPFFTQKNLNEGPCP